MCVCVCVCVCVSFHVVSEFAKCSMVFAGFIAWMAEVHFIHCCMG